MSVYVVATLDTKGAEAAFVRDRLRGHGVEVAVVDAGAAGPPAFAAEVPREAVFEAAGTTAGAVREAGDRGRAVTLAAEGVANLLEARHAAGGVSGVLGMGGSAGTTIATAAMRRLPLGVPKLVVSTLASGDVGRFVGVKDILMMHAVVDLAGLNRVSRSVLAGAADAMAGMVRLGREAPTDPGADRPIVAATMFGVTTPCVEHARSILEAAGYEVLVFHATGSGGRAMEGLIRDGAVAGVLDITTTELADELVGGFLSAGPDRLEAAGARGLPQVVSVGATDMVNFYGIDTVPDRFRERRLHRHNANITLMRTTPEENARIGRAIGSKVAAARGPSAVLLPGRGVSALDREGQPFDDPAARRALFESIRANAGGVEVVELDRNINDPEFADAAARRLLAMLGAPTTRTSTHGPVPT